MIGRIALSGLLGLGIMIVSIILGIFILPAFAALALIPGAALVLLAGLVAIISHLSSDLLNNPIFILLSGYFLSYIFWCIVAFFTLKNKFTS